MRHTFFGGVCPAPHKDRSKRKPIAELDAAPKKVYIPLLTCPDGPATVMVKPGDKVQLGQAIARGNDQSAPIHASVSGKVVSIEEHPHIWGGTADTVVIENDGKNTPWSGAPLPLKEEDIDLDTLISRVTECGVVGMGRGAMPIGRKLKKAADGQVGTLIINAAECEPFITGEHRLWLEHCDQLLQTGRTIARCLGCKRIVIVTEGDKLNAAEQIERRIPKSDAYIELILLRTRYPLGAEKQIVQTVTGHELMPGTDPIDIGCVVLNTATIYAIHQAVCLGKALTHRVVTVTGGAVTRPRNLWVPIGTPLRHLLQEAGQLRDGCAQLMTNGVMMGRGVDSLDAGISKDTKALIALDAHEFKDEVETTCIRCGKCAASCPMHLVPSFIARAVRDNDAVRLKKLHPQDCMGCGCCSFVCPANIPLTELVRKAALGLQEGGQTR